MSKILAIKSATTKAGRPVVIVETAERTVWVPFGMWTNTGADTNFEAYIGGNIDADYFLKGEELISGDVANDDNIILRSVSVSMNSEVLAHMASINANKKAESLNSAALLFRRKRDEATAKAKADKAAADALAAEAAAKLALAGGVKGPVEA